MNNIFNKLSNMIKDDEIKNHITTPLFNYLYNELYLYIWLLCIYHIIFIIMILIICFALFEIYHNIKFLRNNNLEPQLFS
jgi:hypothetical protein